FVMVDGHFDRSAAGEFTWAVQAAAAAHLRKITARKIKATYADLNKVGAPTGPAPLGFRYVGNNRASFMLEPDPETAAIVRDIFNRYATGRYSTTEIAAQLTAEKVPTASRHGWIP